MQPPTIVVIVSTGKTGGPLPSGWRRIAAIVPSYFEDIALTARGPRKRVSLVTSRQQPPGSSRKYTRHI
jgi:hypothetical protein